MLHTLAVVSKFSRLVFTTLTLVAACSFQALPQWVQTNGPYGGQTYAILEFTDLGGSKSLLAGTDDGVFLSSNSGASWTSTSAGLTNRTVYTLAVSGTNLFAGTAAGGVFLSTNGGASWTAVNTALTNTSVYALAASGTNLFAGTGGGVFRSTNSGTSWTPASTGLLNTNVRALAVTGTNLFTGTVGGGVFLSTNNGASWTSVSTGLTNSDVRSLAVSGTNIFAGTYGSGVFLSSNSGTSWVPTNTGMINTVVYAFAVSGTNLFAGTGDAGIFLSTNNGTSWAARNTGLTNNYIQALAVSGTNLFAGTGGGGIFLSTNSGASWASASAGLTNSTVHTLAVSGTNLFAGTYGGGVFLSTNNGASWAQRNSGLTLLDIFALAVSGPYVFAGNGDGAFRSTSNGANWTHINSGLTVNIVDAFAFIGPYVFAGNGGGVNRSSDSGTNWIQVNNGLTNIQVQVLAVSGSNLFAGTYGGGVFLSTDNGTSWTQVNNGLTNTDIFAFAPSGPNLFAATGGGGVFLSTNNGTSWSAAGLTSLNVLSLAVLGTYLWAGTESDGVFLSTNSGASWTQINTGSTSNNVRALAVNGTNLFAGTYGAGVWRRPLSDFGFPTATTNDASPIGPTGATLNGTVNPNGLATNYYFEYGLTAGYGTTTTQQNAGSSASPVTVSTAVTGLAPGMLYHYRLVATNSAGTTPGNDVTFTTTSDSNLLPNPSFESGNLSAPDGWTTFLQYAQYFWSMKHAHTGAYSVGISNATETYRAYTWYTKDLIPVAPADSFEISAWFLLETPPPADQNIGFGVHEYDSNRQLITGWTSGVYFPTSGAVGNWKQFVWRGQCSPQAAYVSAEVGTNIGTSISTMSPAYFDDARFVITGRLTLPVAPLLSWPLSAASGLPKILILSWNPVRTAASYDLQLSTDSLFVHIVLEDSALTAVSLQVGPLQDSTTYFWRVRAKNALGFGDFSSTWSFTTIATSVPATPQILAASGIGSREFNANWSPVTGATGYQLDVAKDTVFAQKIPGYDSLNVGNFTSQKVTTLTPGTRYYYRVRSVNTVGTSSSSNLVPVLTLPDAPSLTSPASFLSDQPTTLALSWNPVQGVTSYQLQLSTDSLFAGTEVDDSTLIGTSKQVGPLKNDTKYYWRVRAMNSSGAGAYSATWNFRTAAVAVPPSPTALAATSRAITSFTANWSSVVGATEYRLDVATDNSFTAMLSGYNNVNVGLTTSFGVTGLSPNTQYYYRVRAVNPGGPSGNSNVVSAFTLASYPSTYSLSATKGFVTRGSLTEYSSSDYQLVGLPGNSSQLISGFLNGQQGSAWEVYWDNGKQGKPQDYYVKYDGGSNFVCAPGKAFWLLHLGDWTINNRVVNSAALNANREASIALTVGQKWNLITNPLDKPLSWSNITSINRIKDSIYAWTSSGWVRADIFSPYQGYLFFNDSNLAFIRVPFDLALPKVSAKSLAEIDGWRINVVARFGRFQDETTSFGVSQGSSKGLDRYEQRKPRSFAGIPDVYFDRKEWDAQYYEFATDVRPGVDELEAWEMKVRSMERKEVELEFVGTERVPENFAVFLVDGTGGRVLDLRKKAKYALTPGTQVTTLSVLVGQPGLVAERVKGIVPTEFALLQNYPNPFNPSTTIPVSIPMRGRVALTIYNVLGEEVIDIFDGILDPGQHFFQWDGKGAGGNAVSSGIYVCRFVVDGTMRSVKKMALVR